MANQTRAPIVQAPPVKVTAPALDRFPNLLVTTLAVVATALPVGKQLSTSAPIVKHQTTSCEQARRALELGIPAYVIPQGAQLSSSAPIAKTQTTACEQARNPLTLGIPQAGIPTSVGYRIVDSAPAVKPAVGSIDSPNLLTLASVTTPALPPGGAWFTSAPAIAGRLSQDGGPWVALYFAPVGIQASATAPAMRQTPSLDVYPYPLTLGINPQATPQQLSSSAPPPKFAVQVDVFPNVTLFGQTPPSVQQLAASAPPPRAPVVVDVYPNLQASTLPPAPTFPIALPLGLPVDVSQWQPKYATQVDVYPNTVLLGIPAPIIPPTPSVYGSNSPSGGGGGGKRDWPDEPRHQRKPTLPAADLIEAQAEARPGVAPAAAVGRIEASQADASKLLAALGNVDAKGTPDDDDDEDAIYLLLS